MNEKFKKAIYLVIFIVLSLAAYTVYLVSIGSQGKPTI